MLERRFYYLGLDQGTTGTTALLLDEQWNQISKGYKEVTQYYPHPGWVEHDPIELYQSLLCATRQALTAAGAAAGEIRCIGLDNQGETVLLWNRETGEPVYPAIVWQDRRTAMEADTLNAQWGDLIQSRTGLRPDAYFGATKIRWVLKNIPLAGELLNAHKLAAGTLDTWLMWKLTGGRQFLTDCVTAGRTCLMNIHTRQWDRDILDLLEIPEEILPELRKNTSCFGHTDPQCFLDASIPLTGSIIDQQAALLGQGCVQSGNVKTTYGTGCFMLMNTAHVRMEAVQGLLSTLAWVHRGKPAYALDGGIYISGAATQWLKNGVQLLEQASDADRMALSLHDNGGLYFVPAFTGLAAPYWDSYARGTILGITAGTTRAHIARAALESTAYQVKDILSIMERSAGLHISAMRADGGSTASRFLMQFQADMLNIPVEVPVISETTALGSAYLAAIGMGDLGGIGDTALLWKCGRRYEPDMSADQRDSLLAKWHRAVDRALGWEASGDGTGSGIARSKSKELKYVDERCVSE